MCNGYSDMVASRATPRPRDVGVTKFETMDTAKNLDIVDRDEPVMKYLEPLLFPDEDTDEGHFYTEVLSAIQRWFCCSGWPNSINLITVPDSLRRYVIHV